MPKYCYDHPRPAVTVDIAAFGLDGANLRLLLVKRGQKPFAGRWALPGGFIEIDEPIEGAARRELREETGLKVPGALAFFGVFGEPTRDPRGRTISIAHAAALRPPLPEVDGADDAAEAKWLDPHTTTGLAFDHDLMVRQALHWLECEVVLGPIGVALLPRVFHDADVQNLHRAIFGSARGATAWRKRVQKSGLARAVAGKEPRYRAIVK
jgi:8-oxo-dGTP diphosphatase